nr:hypothetical protein [Geobacter sp.]
MKERQGKATIVTRPALLQLTAPVTKLVHDIYELYAGRTGKGYGWFQADGTKNFRLIYLRPALDAGLIEMTIPDKPRSSNQRYRLTAKGRQFLEQLKKAET